MPLTDVACRNAKASDKPIKLFDGQGLYLLVQPSGSKLWRLKYRFEGKEKLSTAAVQTRGAVRAAPAARRRSAQNYGMDSSTARTRVPASASEFSILELRGATRNWPIFTRVLSTIKPGTEAIDIVLLRD